MKYLCRGILLCFILFPFILLTVSAMPAWPEFEGVQAEAGVVIDMDSGAVLFGQNMDQAYPPASITKLLTALVVLENCQLDEIVTFSSDAVNNIEEGSGNKMNIAVGDTLTVEDCLYLLLLQSSNQTANALAEHTAGSRSEFVKIMNERIAQIGCSSSNFGNPSGLNDDAQYVTAYEMSLIARAAYSNQKLMEINTSLSRTMPPTINNPNGCTIAMEHKLLNTSDQSSPFYYPFAKAGKTGYTTPAGNTLVTYGEKDGRRLISVVLRGTPSQYYLDSKAMLEFGFSNFRNQNASELGAASHILSEAVETAERSYSPSELSVDPQSMVTLPVDGNTVDIDIYLSQQLSPTAPAGTVAQFQYTYGEHAIGHSYLLPSDNVPASANPAGNDTVSNSPSHKAGIPSTSNAPRFTSYRRTKFSKPGIPFIMFALLMLAGMLRAAYLSMAVRQQREYLQRAESQKTKEKA